MTHPVQQRRNPPELQQLVPLQPLSQLDGIVLIIRLQGASERDVVLLLDQQVIVRLVDDGEVELLRGDKVRLGERQVVLVLEDLDHSRVVQPWRQGSEEVGKEDRLVVEIEADGSIGYLHVGNLDGDLLELVVIPVGQSLHHGESSVIGLVWRQLGSISASPGRNSSP